MSKGIAASDVIRSMMRAGFAPDEIYDLLTEIGIKGEQVQLLTDRVAHEFREAKIEPRPSMLATEVQRLFLESNDDLRHEIFSRLESLFRQLELVKTAVEKLAIRVSRTHAGWTPRKTDRGKNSARDP